MYLASIRTRARLTGRAVGAQIIVEDGSAEGFKTVSEARQMLINGFGKAVNPRARLSVVAPVSRCPSTADSSPAPAHAASALQCPHMEECPRAAEGTRPCSFMVRVSRASHPVR